MKNQSKLPLYQALIKHSQAKPISFHVPGHKYGSTQTAIDEDFFKKVLQIDATELTGLDDLHSPEGVIQEAEVLLADLYKVKKSFFLVNGSTVGNMAMIMAACEKEDVVLVQRNCHKSILNALKLTQVKPVFLEPEFDSNWRVATGVSIETVRQAIAQYPAAKALILTYPNYYGMVYDLSEIISLAHHHNIPALVDEAHGPHFTIGDPFPASAISCGADVVVQSAHKTLPAMTMGSYLHVNSDRIPLDQLEEYLHILQSSSPSYPIMASLDIARNYLANYIKADRDYLVSEITHFKNELAMIPGIKVLEYPNRQGDFLKVTIQSRCELNGFELQKRMELEGIYTELADPHNVLFILPLLKEKQHYPLDETIKKIKRILVEEKYQPMIDEEVLTKQPKISELAIPFKVMRNLQTQDVPIHEAAGVVCADTVIPYPPGIPLLLKGERITDIKIKTIYELIEKGARFQGKSKLEKGLITVFSDTQLLEVKE